MPIDWDMGASLIDSGGRFPVHGTIRSCIEAWQKLPPEQQQEATLLTVVAVSAPEVAAPKTSYRGQAIHELVALLGPS